MSRVIELLNAIRDGASYNAIAESRVDEILKAIKASSAYSATAQSRHEELLLAIKNGTTTTLAPQSRLEEILVAIANNSLVKCNFTQKLTGALFSAGTTVTRGVTIINNDDCTFNATGTAEANIYYKSSNVGLDITHKYMLSGTPIGADTDQTRVYIDFLSGGSYAGYKTDLGGGVIFTPTTNTGEIIIFIGAGVALNNQKYVLQMFDLTNIYGAGNEATETAAFRNDFPAELYGYNTGTTIGTVSGGQIKRFQSELEQAYVEAATALRGN